MTVKKNHHVSPTVRESRKNVFRKWFFSAFTSPHQESEVVCVAPKHIFPLIFICLITFSIIALNSWHDTQWGGDTGEEVYTIPDEPIEPPPKNLFDNCCGNVIFIGGVVFSAFGVKKWKKIK